MTEYQEKKEYLTLKCSTIGVSITEEINSTVQELLEDGTSCYSKIDPLTASLLNDACALAGFKTLFMGGYNVMQQIEATLKSIVSTSRLHTDKKVHLSDQGLKLNEIKIVALCAYFTSVEVLKSTIRVAVCSSQLDTLNNTLNEINCESRVLNVKYDDFECLNKLDNPFENEEYQLLLSRLHKSVISAINQTRDILDKKVNSTSGSTD